MVLHRKAALLLLAASASAATTVSAFGAAPRHVTAVRPSPCPGRGRCSLNYASGAPPSEADASLVPSCIVSPVLAQLYPALVLHKAKYGNPNIPLGSIEGKKCATLRRLHFNNKLSAEEEACLTELGFRFRSFEDVYYENDFDEMLEKLRAYHAEFRTYQIPKKYEPDPELGAWVTMLRRLHATREVPRARIRTLDAVGFEWQSTRKCGSAFMAAYRDTLSRLTGLAASGGDVRDFLRTNPETVRWIKAQRRANDNGKLPASRVQYMHDLPGLDWQNPSSWE